MGQTGILWILLAASVFAQEELFIAQTEQQLSIVGNLTKPSEFWICVDYEAVGRGDPHANEYPTKECGGTPFASQNPYWFGLHGVFGADGSLEVYLASAYEVMAESNTTIVFDSPAGRILSPSFPKDGNTEFQLTQKHFRTVFGIDDPTMDIMTLVRVGSVHVRAVANQSDIHIRISGDGFSLIEAFEETLTENEAGVAAVPIEAIPFIPSDDTELIAKEIDTAETEITEVEPTEQTPTTAETPEPFLSDKEMEFFISKTEEEKTETTEQSPTTEELGSPENLNFDVMFRKSEQKPNEQKRISEEETEEAIPQTEEEQLWTYSVSDQITNLSLIGLYTPSAEGNEFWSAPKRRIPMFRLCVDYETNATGVEDPLEYPAEECGGEAPISPNTYWYAVRGRWLADGQLSVRFMSAFEIWTESGDFRVNPFGFPWDTFGASANSVFTLKQSPSNYTDVDILDLVGSGSVHVRRSAGNVRIHQRGYGLRIIKLFRDVAEKEETPTTKPPTKPVGIVVSVDELSPDFIAAQMEGQHFERISAHSDLRFVHLAAVALAFVLLFVLILLYRFASAAEEKPVESAISSQPPIYVVGKLNPPVNHYEMP